jgi:hypothetical protein
LDALTHINGGIRVTDGNAEGVKDMKELALEICEETFLGVKSPRLEVERGFRFWDVVSRTPFSFFISFLFSLSLFHYLSTFSFWGLMLTNLFQALTAMRQLHSEGAVLRELIDQFEAAEAWLAPMRP